MLRGPVTKSIESPVFVVALHNMVQVYEMLHENVAATKYRGQLAHVLRLMGASRGISERQYEEFYIKLLSLPKANCMAPAAWRGERLVLHVLFLLIIIKVYRFFSLIADFGHFAILFRIETGFYKFEISRRPFVDL